MLELRASVLRALAFVVLLSLLASSVVGLPLPDHAAVCVDSSRNQLLWKITYQGAGTIHLEYSSLNNAYRHPLGIDGTQPHTFFPEKPVYFWASLDTDQSEHRWVLAGNSISIRPASLPPCSRQLDGECVGGIYDYCDTANLSGFCHPMSCNPRTSQCEIQDHACPDHKPVCIDNLRSCVECRDSTDCHARSPVPFCEGGWHCTLSTHMCERTPPPCDDQDAECDAETKTCRKYACSSHVDCDDGNPCNGREICDFNLRTCYTDPMTPIPCGGDATKCDVTSGRCHECDDGNDCQPTGTILYPCEPRKACGIDSTFPSLRICVETEAVVQCEKEKHCDNQSGECVTCVYDDDCYPEDVQMGRRSIDYCDGEFYCHKNECVHYGRCIDENRPFCIGDTKTCSECRSDDECRESPSFCSPKRVCNLQSGTCEMGESPCEFAVVTLANGAEAEMPMECDEENRMCVQSVLCLTDAHCHSGSFCSLGETCNVFTGLCELDLHDDNGTLVPFSPCGDLPCLDDEERCGYPTDVLITVSILAGIWVLVLSTLALLCACCGKLS